MAYWIEYNVTESIWTLPPQFRWHSLPYESCLRRHCQSFKASLDFDMASNTELLAVGALGVLPHNLLFTHGEWHLQAPSLLKLHAVGYTSVAVFKSTYCQLSWLSAANTSLCLCGMYVLCLWASMSIYRLFFHRIREFPGPALASVSKFWRVAHCLDSKNHLLLEKLRQKYGGFVRTGMANRRHGHEILEAN